ncbi:MAG: sulfatase-like hydrolase/transferase [Proteobacteria bacterium]|nr:sulfatase-like hydrolase/transferase [Pseudomonadota bacterium]MCP4918417.1 sulfatase-like hydrolase/transferase [Pseudomonadota bacterium]
MLLWIACVSGLAPAEEAEQAGLTGLGLMQKGRTEDAIPHLERAVELAPEDVRNRQALVVAHSTLGDTVAVSAICAELDPDASAARTQHVCGNALLDQGDAAALAWLDRVVAGSPALLPPRERRAEARVLAGELDVAVDELRRLAMTHPNGPDRERLLARSAELGAAIPRAEAAITAPNVVLFVLDTVRADRLGAYGHRTAKTPNIDRLARTGVLFEDATSQAPWTAASIASLMSGLYPSVHGLDSGASWGPGEKTGDLPFLVQKSLAPSHVTLAERLRAEGYATAGFISNTYVNTVFGLAQGFDEYADDHSDYSVVSKRRGEKTTAEVEAWLETAPEPFFLFVHYNDAHWPYDPLPPFDEGTRGYTGDLTPEDTHAVVERHGEAVTDLSTDDLDYLLALYDGEISYADHQVGLVLEAVAAKSERPVLTVLTSDHGEEFLDHGGTSHGYTLYQEQVHVPLLFNGAGLPTDRRVSGPVRSLDVPSTVLDVLGEGALGQGQSLLPMLEGGPGPETVFSEATYKVPQRAVRRGDSKRIEDVEAGTARVFDLAADPDELQAGEDVPELRAVTESWATDNAALRATLGHAEDAVVLDAETSEALRALGYVD